MSWRWVSSEYEVVDGVGPLTRLAVHPLKDIEEVLEAQKRERQLQKARRNIPDGGANGGIELAAAAAAAVLVAVAAVVVALAAVVMVALTDMVWWWW